MKVARPKCPKSVRIVALAAATRRKCTVLVRFSAMGWIVGAGHAGCTDDAGSAVESAAESVSEAGASSEISGTESSDSSDSTESGNTTSPCPGQESLCPDGSIACFGQSCPTPSCGSTCDIWDLNDCSEGEKCSIVGCESGVGWDSNVCRELRGAKVAGEPCVRFNDGADDCDVGFHCSAYAHGAQGVCLEQCLGTWTEPTCSEGLECFAFADGILPLCSTPCDDPFAAACDEPLGRCAPGSRKDAPDVWGCAPSGGDFGVGEVCEHPLACAQGLSCVPEHYVPDCEGWRCCSELCDLQAPAMCSLPGQVCDALYWPEPAPVGQEHVGVCRLP